MAVLFVLYDACDSLMYDCRTDGVVQHCIKMNYVMTKFGNSCIILREGGLNCALFMMSKKEN